MIIYFRFNTVAASEPNWMSQPNLCPPLLRRKSALAPGVWPVPFPRIAPSRDRRHSRFCLREIHPVQSADAVVEVPQAQRFSDGTGMEIRRERETRELRPEPQRAALAGHKTACRGHAAPGETEISRRPQPPQMPGWRRSPNGYARSAALTGYSTNIPSAGTLPAPLGRFAWAIQAAV